MLKVINYIQISFLSLRHLLFSILLIFLFQSCSVDRLVIRQVGGVLDYGVLALYEETDLKLAEQSLASNIKLLEGLIKGDPENEHLLLLTAQALSGYALGFAEDEEPERAKRFYLRARDYGLRVLRQDRTFQENEKSNLDDFTLAINQLDMEYLPAIFWTAFSWAGWANLSIDNPRALIELPKVQVMMQRVLDLDETFFHASAHLFFGSIWGTKPPMLGGDLQKAKGHFDRNIEITEGKFLISYVYYARYYAAKVLDETLLDEFITKIEDTPAEVLPGFQFLNTIAKKKVKYLKELKKELF